MRHKVSFWHPNDKLVVASGRVQLKAHIENYCKKPSRVRGRSAGINYALNLSQDVASTENTSSGCSAAKVPARKLRVGSPGSRPWSVRPYRLYRGNPSGALSRIDTGYDCQEKSVTAFGGPGWYSCGVLAGGGIDGVRPSC